MDSLIYISQTVNQVELFASYIFPLGKHNFVCPYSYYLEVNTA